MEIEDLAFILFPGIIVSMEFVIGSLLGENKMVWYNKLKKPIMCPPNWVFFPMWTFLYIMIGLGGYILWSQNKEFSSEHKEAWISFFAHMAFNYTFTPIFFRLHMIKTACVHITITDCVMIWNFVVFLNLDWNAGLCLLPNVLWTLFASYLIYGILYYNPNGVEKYFPNVAPGDPSVSKADVRRVDTDAASVSKISSYDVGSSSEEEYSYPSKISSIKRKKDN